MLKSKNYWGLASACIGLWICLIFTFTTKYLYHTDKLDERLADLALTTIDDYAVQLRLPHGLYRDWYKKNEHRFTDETIPIQEFEKDMTESIKRQIVNDEDNRDRGITMEMA